MAKDNKLQLVDKIVVEMGCTVPIEGVPYSSQKYGVMMESSSLSADDLTELVFEQFERNLQARLVEKALGMDV